MDLSITAPLLSFLVIMFIYGGIASARREKEVRINSRLQKYTKNVDKSSSSEKENEDEGTLRNLFRTCSKILAPKGWIKRAEKELAQADIPLRPEEYVAIRILLIVAGSIIFYTLGIGILLTALMIVLLAVLPPLLVRSTRAKRVQVFNNQLGEGLVIMANSLRAGLGFMQAVDTLSQEMPPPLSTEFERLIKEINLGTPTEEALDNMLNRVDSEDLDLVITAVKIQRQVGGNLAEILDRIGSTIGQRIKMKSELKTLTAQGRMSGLIIGLLPVAIVGIIFVINPEYMSILFSHPVGLLMLAAAVVSEIVGFFVIKNIVSIDF